MSIKEQVELAFPVHVNVAAGQKNLKLWSLDVLVGTLQTSYTVLIGNKATGFDTAVEAIRFLETEL